MRTPSNTRRIAIIGNMNNSGFAIMRYFRDLRADAYLLPYTTDGAANLAHFTPETDTWEIERWRAFIRPLGMPNTSEAVLCNPRRLKFPPSSTALAKKLEGYNCFVGSGIAPAMLARLGMRLDIFFPYGAGIEFYGDIEFRARKGTSWMRGFFYDRLRCLQADGIKRARYCFNAEMSLTKASFEEIGKSFERLAVPMVYNGERAPTASDLPPHLHRALERIEAADLSLFCCSRLLWVRDRRLSDDQWHSFSKNSDWLLRGLAAFISDHPAARPCLAIVEYGPDVEATKKIAYDLGLENQILWLPKMARREIMALLAHADIGVGEFHIDPGIIWGGTGWEVLASGRPLLQSFNFTPAEFQSEFGHVPPPILDVKSPQDVARRLAEVYASADAQHEMGCAARKWFDQYGGVGLARRWLERLADDELVTA